MELFPDLPLTMLLKVYFAYQSIPLAQQGGNEIESKKSVENDSDVMLVSASSQPTALFLMPPCRMHFQHSPTPSLHLEYQPKSMLGRSDYQNAIKVAESGLELVRRVEIDNGKKLTRYG